MNPWHHNTAYIAALIHTDKGHCGQCLALCAGNAICVDGDCACPAGTVNCAGVCANLLVAGNDCGACGTQCDPAQVCVAFLPGEYHIASPVKASGAQPTLERVPAEMKAISSGPIVEVSSRLCEPVTQVYILGPGQSGIIAGDFIEQGGRNRAIATVKVARAGNAPPTPQRLEMAGKLRVFPGYPGVPTLLGHGHVTNNYGAWVFKMCPRMLAHQ